VLTALRANEDPAARWSDAAALLDDLVLGEYEDFLTVPGYKLLVRGSG